MICEVVRTKKNTTAKTSIGIFLDRDSAESVKQGDSNLLGESVPDDSSPDTVKSLFSAFSVVSHSNALLLFYRHLSRKNVHFCCCNFFCFFSELFFFFQKKN